MPRQRLYAIIPEDLVQMYVIVDDQSDRSVARSEFFDIFHINGPSEHHTTASCTSGVDTSVRRAPDIVVESLGGDLQLHLPTLRKCNDIPDNWEEIPIPGVAKHYSHIYDITGHVVSLDSGAHIPLLAEKDFVEAYHILNLRIGSKNSSFCTKTQTRLGNNGGNKLQ